MIVYVARNYTVYTINAWRLALHTAIVCVIIVSLLIYSEVSDVTALIIGFISSVLASILIEVNSTSNIIFSDEIITDMLTTVNENDSSYIEKYSEAIKKRLTKRSIIIKKRNKFILNDLLLLFEVYSSCIPIKYDYKPNIDNTLELFAISQGSNESIFVEYGIDIELLANIFTANCYYYHTYFQDLGEQLDKLQFVNANTSMEALVNSCQLPLSDLKGQAIGRYVGAMERFDLAKKALQTGDDQGRTSAVYNHILELYNHLISLEEISHNHAIRSIIGTTCLLEVDYLFRDNSEVRLASLSPVELDYLKTIQFYLKKTSSLNQFYCNIRYLVETKNISVRDFEGVVESGFRQFPSLKVVLYLNQLAILFKNRRYDDFSDMILLAERSANDDNKTPKVEVQEGDYDIFSAVGFTIAYYKLVSKYRHEKLEESDILNLLNLIVDSQDFLRHHRILLRMVLGLAKLTNNQGLYERILDIDSVDREFLSYYYSKDAPYWSQWVVTTTFGIESYLDDFVHPNGYYKKEFFKVFTTMHDG